MKHTLTKAIYVFLAFGIFVPMTTFAAFDTDLKVGSKNKTEVKALQTFLKSQGLYKGSVNGSYGPLTKSAVKAYQKKNGLSQTGSFDASTRSAAQTTSGSATSSTTGTSGTQTPTAQPSTTSRTTGTDTGKSTTDFTAVASGNVDAAKLPLGDQMYSTTEAKKGYIYACNVTNGGGADKQGPWITGTTWDSTKKINVSGDVAWPNATFTMKLDGSNRVFTGNDLPTTHNTGTYPISSPDAAYSYDKNPNTIKAQTESVTLPANPTVYSTPTCMRGSVGIATSGVLIFNGFDAAMRDAVANEVQDKCSGHPQESGAYHYHSGSSCLKDTRSGPGGSSDLLGWAFDGFGIYGAYGSNGKEFASADLDECHGTTGKVMWDGKEVTMYHYVATRDFPYTVSCFRGKSYEAGPSGGNGQGGQGQNGQGMGQNGMQNCPAMQQGGSGSGQPSSQPSGTSMQGSQMQGGMPQGGQQSGQTQANQSGSQCPPPPMCMSSQQGGQQSGQSTPTQTQCPPPPMQSSGGTGGQGSSQMQGGMPQGGQQMPPRR